MKYKKLHEAFQEYDMSTDPPQDLFTAIRLKLKEVYWCKFIVWKAYYYWPSSNEDKLWILVWKH